MSTKIRRATKAGAADSAYASRLAGLRAATRAIGKTASEQLAWVLRFIEEDPATWHPAVRHAHADCLFALARPALDNWEPLHPEYFDDPFEPGDVEALQAELRAMLRDLLGTNPTGHHKVPIPTD